MRRGLRIASWGAALALTGLLALFGFTIARENHAEAPEALRWVQGHVRAGQALNTVLPAFAERGFICRDETAAARRNDPEVGKLTMCSKTVQENFAQVRDVHASLRTNGNGTIVAVGANMTRTTL